MKQRKVIHKKIIFLIGGNDPWIRSRWEFFMCHDFHLRFIRSHNFPYSFTLLSIDPNCSTNFLFWFCIQKREKFRKFFYARAAERSRSAYHVTQSRFVLFLMPLSTDIYVTFANCPPFIHNLKPIIIFALLTYDGFFYFWFNVQLLFYTFFFVGKNFFSFSLSFVFDIKHHKFNEKSFHENVLKFNNLQCSQSCNKLTSRLRQSDDAIYALNVREKKCK